jgi:hypothetical protein
LNSRRVALLRHDKLQRQLLGLERSAIRGGRDRIDHVRGAKDDVANAVAGAVVLASKAPSAAIITRIRRPIVYPKNYY